MTTIDLGVLDDYTSGGATSVPAAGRVLVVVRIDDSLYVLDDRCSHADFPLSTGEVNVETCEIECDRHGGNFSLATGEPTSFPATRPVATYEVVNRDGRFEVVVP
jgi:3-phenylpropionate/trans-cinnamate dioxygenase ferredoxin component